MGYTDKEAVGGIQDALDTKVINAADNNKNGRQRFLLSACRFI